MSTIVALFDELLEEPRPPQAAFRTRHIDRIGPHRIAIDAAACPYILIETPIAPVSVEPVPLRHIIVRYERRCRVIGTNGEEVRAFAAIGCIDADPALQHYFLRIMEGTLPSLGRTPAWTDIIAWIRRILELFAALDVTPRQNVQGLWAELFVISEWPNPTTLLRAWHGAPTDVFDFSSGGLRLEVKSTTFRVRKHRISLEQARPSPGTRGVIASILLDTAGDGASIYDLVDSIRPRIGDLDLMAKLETVIATTLGSGWRHAEEFKFDLEYAKSHLRYVSCEHVPSVTLPLPLGVTNVHFDASLDQCEALSADDVSKLQEAWRLSTER